MSATLYFEIQADDTKRAIDFYAEVFGWQFSRAEGLPTECWRIEADGSQGGLLKRPAPAPGAGHGTNAFVCSFEVKSFDGVATKIMEKSGQIALPKFAVPGVCWQGYFLDTENNTFGIFEPDPAAK